MKDTRDILRETIAFGLHLGLTLEEIESAAMRTIDTVPSAAEREALRAEVAEVLASFRPPVARNAERDRAGTTTLPTPLTTRVTGGGVETDPDEGLNAGDPVLAGRLSTGWRADQEREPWLHARRCLSPIPPSSSPGAGDRSRVAPNLSAAEPESNRDFRKRKAGPITIDAVGFKCC